MTKWDIENAVLAGITIKVPYKLKYEDYFTEVYIRWSPVFKQFVVENEGNCRRKEFNDVADAVDYFWQTAIHSKNLALAINRLEYYNIINKERDALSNMEMRKAVKKYFDVYFKVDFVDDGQQ